VRSADEIVYSGAGEVGDYDAFLRQALVLEIAFRSGVPFSIVNHSMVITSPALLSVAAPIYLRARRIVVRGSISRTRLLEMGVAESRIVVAPDTAWRTIAVPREERERSARPRIAVVINALAEPEGTSWLSVLPRLAQRGELVFTTTDAYHDHTLAERLARRFGGTYDGPPLSAHDAMLVLSRVDVVVSSRLHACVLAVLCGTPAIAVERGGHKTIESFELARVGVPVIPPSAEDFDARIAAAVEDALVAPESRRVKLLHRAQDLRAAAGGNRV
jgi:polysaccharide pyruvyl transferase WcaK-like protein